MSGSEQQSKTSKVVENQLPLKGFSNVYEDAVTGRKFRIEGMGDGRYRIATRKRQPRKK
jgi:hypothetical protein